MTRSTAVAGLILAFASCAAFGQAASGVIYACVGNSGLPQIVAAGTSCKKNESLVSWSMAGPTGPAGPRGPSSAFLADSISEPIGTVSTVPSSPTRLVALQLSPGSYVLNGVAGLKADIDFGSLVPFANVGCTLTDSMGPIGATFRMLVGGKATSHASVPLAAAVILSSADTVAIDCVAEIANGITISTQPSVLTAIQVGTLGAQ